MTTEDGTNRSRPYRRFLLPTALFVAGICAAAFFILHREPEPVFEGRTLSQWLPDLQSNNAEVRRKATEAFREMGPKAVPFFVADLNRIDSVPRAYLITFMKRFPSLRSRWMSESERHYRSISVLRKMQPHSKEVIAVLSTHLLNTNTGIQALNALVSVGGGKSLSGEMAEPLAVGLQSADVRVRKTAAHEMRNLPSNNSAAVTALQQALKDKAVRLTAALSLAKLSTDAAVVVPAYVYLLEQQPGFERVALDGIVRFESKAAEAVPALMRLATSEDNELRRQAVYALGKVRSDGQRVLPFLVTLLEDSDGLVGRNAAYAIGAFGSEASNAIPALIKAKKSDDEDVRNAAAYTLRNMLKVDPIQTP